RHSLCRSRRQVAGRRHLSPSRVVPERGAGGQSGRRQDHSRSLLHRRSRGTALIMTAETNATRVLRREAGAPRVLSADLCVLGAGIAGVSAALEAARLGARVVLAEGGMTLGGQSVAAQIGTFCGLFANGPQPPQVTRGVADDILRDLGAQGDLHYRRIRRNTVI